MPNKPAKYGIKNVWMCNVRVLTLCRVFYTSSVPLTEKLLEKILNIVENLCQNKPNIQVTKASKSREMPS